MSTAARWTATATVAVATAGLVALALSGSAPANSASTATVDGRAAARCAAQKKRLAAAKKAVPVARRAYFRKHPLPKDRRRFVNKQKTTLKKLQRTLAACLRRARSQPKPKPPVSPLPPSPQPVSQPAEPPPPPAEPPAPPAEPPPPPSPPTTPLACADAQAPPPVATPQPDAEVRGTTMTVTTNSDLSNGDTSSWISLQASPGPDGVSLREALEVTNSAPGDYTIRFAQQLAGAAVQVGAGDDLPALTGGSVFINGDIDGDGKPDVTLSNVRPHEPNAFAFGLKISSSGNRLHALVLENFSIGVFFRPLSGDGRYADNEVSRVVFRGMHVAGIVQNSGVGAPGTELTNNHWLRTRLIGNTIESKGDGIAFFLYEAIGDVVEQLVVSDNAIRITESGGRGISIAVGGLAGSRDNRLSDAVISGNSIEGAAFAAIGVSSGELGASNNTVERLRVAGNRIRIDSPTTPEGFSRMAIGVAAGDGATDHNNPGTSPILYPENNVMRDVEIAGNTLTGRGGLSIAVSGGCCGAAGNFVTGVRIAGNTVRGTSPGAPTVSLVGAASGGYYSRSSTENDISDVSVEGNSITLVPEEPAAEFAAGLFWTGGVLVGGGQAANTGRVQDVRVRSNCIDTEYIGISVVGGFGDPGFPAAGNTVSHVEVRGNVVSRPPVQLNQFRPEVRGIHLTGGIDATTGNSVSCVVVADNHVAGVLDALSTLDDIGAGASGNVATTVGC